MKILGRVGIGWNQVEISKVNEEKLWLSEYTNSQSEQKTSRQKKGGQNQQSPVG